MAQDLPVTSLPLPAVVVRGIVAVLATVAMLATGTPQATADELDDRKAELQQQLAAQAAAIEGASAEVAGAVSALQAATAELEEAEAELAAAERATEEARALDEQRAQELAAAEHKLRQAIADVAAAQAAFDAVDARTNEEITVITQQSGPLVDLALLFSDIEMSDLNHRAQLAETLFDSSALELDELTARRLQLEAAETAAEEAEAAAREAREAAARQLEETEAREAAADALRASVADKVAARDAALAAAENELANEQARQQALETEAADVEKRIAERIRREEEARIAAEKAAAAKAAAEKAAAEKAAADRAAAEKAAAAKAAASTPSRTDSSTSRNDRPAAPKPAPKPAAKPAAPSTSFMLPVQGRLTSHYGMRLHPVLGYRKLHDGTDFAAACGTPMRAAYSGVVAERYYNAGYGNRLMIDHGRINGAYVTTGYNHASRYIVSPGQRVSKGQVIGYVGTTGYSTGCHLHLMVWQNGSIVNPMSKWF